MIQALPFLWIKYFPCASVCSVVGFFIFSFRFFLRDVVWFSSTISTRTSDFFPLRNRLLIIEIITPHFGELIICRPTQSFHQRLEMSSGTHVLAEDQRILTIRFIIWKMSICRIFNYMRCWQLRLMEQ